MERSVISYRPWSCRPAPRTQTTLCKRQTQSLQPPWRWDRLPAMNCMWPLNLLSTACGVHIHLCFDCSQGASEAFLHQLLYCESSTWDYDMSHHDAPRLQKNLVLCFVWSAFLARWLFRGKTYVVRRLQGGEAGKNLREISFHFLPTVVRWNCNQSDWWAEEIALAYA